MSAVALPVPDPEPDEDLPSDVAFGAFLATLDPATVTLDRERSMHGVDYHMMMYVRHNPRPSRVGPASLEAEGAP